MVDEKKKSNENDRLIRLTLIDIYQSRHQTNGSEFSPRSIRSDLRRCNNKNATVPGALDASAANREKTEYKGKRHLTGLYIAFRVFWRYCWEPTISILMDHHLLAIS